MQVIHVKSAIRNYDVFFSETTDFLAKLENINPSLYIIDSNVWEIYSKELFTNINETDVMVLPIHEDLKNLDTVTKIYDALMSRSAKRNITLISIGGGITQDITGFAASTLYHRPHDIWQIPKIISEWNLDYQFYLRTHGYSEFETVVYAIPRM